MYELEVSNCSRGTESFHHNYSVMLVGCFLKMAKMSCAVFDFLTTSCPREP